MKRLSLRFPNWSRALFSCSLLLSLVSGLLWFGLDRWGTIEGEFGSEKHPWLAPLAKIHGAGAFIALISFGMILSGHVPAGWRAGWSRRSGLFSLSTIAVSILTAYGLYYSGADEWRERIGWMHLIAGLALPVSIALHVWSGRKRATDR